jgi:hypothetical protein
MKLTSDNGCTQLRIEPGRSKALRLGGFDSQTHAFDLQASLGTRKRVEQKGNRSYNSSF